MAGPMGRIIAQVVITGFGIVTRAFVQAYQQAAANPQGAEKIAKEAANRAKAFRSKMSEEEALKVLNFSQRPENFEEISSKAKAMMEANDPGKGGSFYIQSKVYRAQEAIELAMGVKDKANFKTTSNNSSKSA